MKLPLQIVVFENCKHYIWFFNYYDHGTNYCDPGTNYYDPGTNYYNPGTNYYDPGTNFSQADFPLSSKTGNET